MELKLPFTSFSCIFYILINLYGIETAQYVKCNGWRILIRTRDETFAALTLLEYKQLSNSWIETIWTVLLDNRQSMLWNLSSKHVSEIWHELRRIHLNSRLWNETGSTTILLIAGWLIETFMELETCTWAIAKLPAWDINRTFMVLK